MPRFGMGDLEKPDRYWSAPRALAGANGGVFPFEHVYAAIDGRLGIRVHGTREMPVWGLAARVSPALYRTRTWAIVDYLATLQGK